MSDIGIYHQSGLSGVYYRQHARTVEPSDEDHFEVSCSVAPRGAYGLGGCSDVLDITRIRGLVVQFERHGRRGRQGKRVLAHELGEIGSHNHSRGFPAEAIVFGRTEWQACDSLRAVACTPFPNLCYRRRESAMFVF